MKQLDLPFKIDKQYENWEFELDALENRLSGYESYKYIGKQLNYFLNFFTHRTELIFNGDYLTSVILTIKKVNEMDLHIINQFLVLNASKQIKVDRFSSKFKVWRIMYFTTYNPRKKQITVIYGKPRFIQKHLLFLQ
ncbi:hypothetical protein FCOL_11455 [Flavobacterium columnare ATCC 49512]|uniref:Uncharacterized protein n=1 Tax=Flavobacterium columnare (strain ATCC 49512 / CIP 103533 / TG 44/87) TaxID=1041826 RepID=G8X7Y0_FLACA|nr:hypothetical protein [Flavobacterium columnare]AEW87094.1 hypothetical protein FCOL_11455 [Flavobacterium columnare ATCC 49512]